MTKTIVQGIKTPKKTQKWAWLGNFKPKVRKIEIAIFNRVNQINTKFEEKLKTISSPSWVVLKTG